MAYIPEPNMELEPPDQIGRQLVNNFHDNPNLDAPFTESQLATHTHFERKAFLLREAILAGESVHSNLFGTEVEVVTTERSLKLGRLYPREVSAEAIGNQLLFNYEPDSLQLVEVVVAAEELGMKPISDSEIMSTPRIELNRFAFRVSVKAGVPITTGLFGQEVTINRTGNNDNGDPSGDREPRVPVRPNDTEGAHLEL